MKSYNNYILENLSLSNNTIIEILKELKKTNNTDLINNILSNTDNHDRSILMNAVKTNKIDLIKFILSFNPNIKHLDKKGLNVIYYAKNAKIIKLLIENGAEFISIEKQPLLVHLAAKKIFNIDLYKKIINSGVVKLTDKNKYNNTMFSLLVTNNKAMNFLANYNITITDDIVLRRIFENVVQDFVYNKNGKITGFITLLKKNIISINCDFFNIVKTQLFGHIYSDNKLEYFIKQLKDVISYKDFVFLDVYNNKHIDGYNKHLFELLADIYDENVIKFVNSLINTDHNNIYYKSCSYVDYLKNIRMNKAKKFNL